MSNPTDWQTMLELVGRTLLGVEHGADGVRLLFSPDGSITVYGPDLKLQAYPTHMASLRDNRTPPGGPPTPARNEAEKARRR